MKIAIIHQGCVPTYRRAFYEKLGEEYVVFAGDRSLEGIATAKPPFAFNHVDAPASRFLGGVVYQPVLREIIGGGYSAIVIGHEVKYVMNLALAVWFRLRGKPVLLWGFGRNVRGPKWLQYALLLLATDYLAYTGGSADQVLMALDRVTVLNNTIDMESEILAHAKAHMLGRDDLRREMSLGLDDVVFLFVGRPLPEKKIDDLIYAVRALKKEGLPVAVKVVTDVYDRDRMAEIFRASDALVIPGYVGLAVCHAFAHGVPVITMPDPLHSPEVEYIQDGFNGMIVDDLKEGLREFALSPTLRQGLAAGAMVSRDKLSLDHMVDAFRRGVTQAVARPKSRRSIGHFLLNLFVGVPLTAVLGIFFVVSAWASTRRNE